MIISPAFTNKTSRPRGTTMSKALQTKSAGYPNSSKAIPSRTQPIARKAHPQKPNIACINALIVDIDTLFFPLQDS
jgi:hypothetical protein